MLTVIDVAKRLNCSESLVYALCAEGKLLHHRIGVGRGTIRVTEEQLAKLLDDCERRGARTPLELKHIRLNGAGSTPAGPQPQTEPVKGKR